MSTRCRWGVALAALIAAWSQPAWCVEADAPTPMVEGLSANLHAPILLPRPNAPWPIVVALTMRSSALREGYLEVDVGERGRPLSQWQGDTRVLVSGVTTFPILMPPMSLGNDHEQLTCTLRWHEHGTTIELGSVVEPMAGEEQLLYLALCLPLAASDSTRSLQHDLSLEYYQWHPPDADETTNLAYQGSALGGLRLRTVPVRMAEEDCPETALGWCAYDAVAIVGDRLRRMKTRQVQALESWILAGGSCCLVCDGELPAPLAELVSRAGLADPGPADGVAARHLRLRYGLGRMVVAKPEEDQQAGAAERAAAWAGSAAFLWKMRREWADDLARLGSWGRRDQARPTTAAPPQVYPSSSGISSMMSLDDPLTRLLWPEHVEVVPIRVILAVFIIFILMIGPGEWFLLGWLRARRFTWLVFPALAILCTVMMAWISRLYLGSSDVRQRLEIIDVGPGGLTLRRCTFEMLFTGSTRIIGDEVRDALRCALPEWRIRQAYAADNAPRRVAEYHGGLPGHYTFTQTVAQWSPSLLRETALSATPLPWSLDLDAIRTPGDVEPIAQKWIAAVADHAAVALLRPKVGVAQWGDQEVLGAFQALNALSFYRQNHSSTFMPEGINVHPRQGQFALFSRMSPAAGATYDDVPILDSSDPDEFAVICLQRRNGTWWMVRRLFHAPARSPLTPQ